MSVSTLALHLGLSGPPAAASAPDGEPADLDDRVEELERHNRQLRKEVKDLREGQAKAEVAQKENAALRRDVEKIRSHQEKLEALQRENAKLREDVEALKREQAETKARVDGLRRLKGRVTGYLDTGFFWVGGDGSGTRSDLGYLTFPEYRNVITQDAWVFMGDPLSTAINSRGDPADVGRSQSIKFDPIDSEGNPTFIVNALNVGLYGFLGDSLTVTGLIDFLPRSRDVSGEVGSFLGDYVDVKLANLRWITPIRRFGLELFAGKIDSVFGREYRYQEAPDRMTVTPTLLCRYTCGRPIGLQSRLTFLRERQLAFNLAVTNGSTMQGTFGFPSEVDSNAFKTLSSRLAYTIPLGAGLEVGASGLVGAQDFQPRDNVLQWQYGFDLYFATRGFEVSGEFVQGEVQGRTEPGGQRCGITQCLQLLGAYGQAGYRVTNWFMPYFRTDWRDALHQSADFVYISELVRFTPGLRFEVGEHVIIKAEYTFNRELGRIPQFPNDIFTSSLIAKF